MSAAVITPLTNASGAAAISPEARSYAVKELARRAGVLPEFFRQWTVEANGRETVVHIDRERRKSLRFPCANGDLWQKMQAGDVETTRATWMTPPPHVAKRIPELIVPFSSERLPSGMPLFRMVNQSEVECRLDLPASVLLTLTRVEETWDGERDEHDRFPARRSIAHQHGYLMRPVVDECALAFQQALQFLVPSWTPSATNFRVKISHDIDYVGIPFALHTTAGHLLKRGTLKPALWDALALFSPLEPTYLKLVSEIVQATVIYGLQSAVYWKASTRGPKDSGYDPAHPKVRQVISWLDERGVEMGIHPGYETFRAPERLWEELQRLRQTLGDRKMGGRQHYLRWAPRTWLDWENCGLSYDSSLGFADHVGFRAGTCVPYRPWLIEQNREARLLEVPLIVMDCTPIHYMGLGEDESRKVIFECIQRCRDVSGVFTLLWHNQQMIDRGYLRLYGDILAEIANSPTFDWQSTDGY